MSSRLRRGSILACLLAVSLGLASAAPALTLPTASPLATDPLAEPDAPIGTKTPVKKRAAQPPPSGALAAEEAIAELRKGGATAPTMHLDATGSVRSVTAAAGQSLGSSADAFVQRYAAAFGLTSSHTTSRADTKVADGVRVSRYQQNAAGLPVLGGEVIVLSDANGSVRSALTDVTPLAPTGKTSLTAPAALAIATKTLKDRFGIADAPLEAKLWLYNPALIGAPGDAALQPTYWVRALEHGHDLASVLVDAGTGKVVLAASEHQELRDRLVCDLANRKVNLDYSGNYACGPTTTLGKQSTTRKEGGKASTVALVNKAYDYLGKTYDYYKRNFGRDSFDGHGSQIQATVRACDSRYVCPYPNAFWDGEQIVFGAGFVTDDVAAHEFTHAVTEYTSNLLYWHQSGAINEAFSDIFGEFVDLSYHDDGTDDTAKAWLVGEGVSTGLLRSMKNPTQYGHPDRLSSDYWYTGEFDQGGVHTNSGVANKAAYLISSGGNFNGQTFPALGLKKSGKLWYRVMHMMPSGGNYEELGLALSSACRSLIGFFGFTLANCTGTVDKVVTATEMLTALDAYRGAPEAPMCLTNPAQPPADLVSYDFEDSRGNWSYEAGLPWYWYSPGYGGYAAHGQGSIVGWTNGPSGIGRTAEMSSWVQLPADKEVFAHMAISLMRDEASGRGGAQIEINANDGGWQRFTGPSQGMPMTNGEIGTRTRGYGSLRLDLSAYKGQKIKLRFVMFSDGVQITRVYMDDFRVSYCDNLTSAPKDAFAYPAPQGPTINWTPPTFVSQTQDGGTTRPMTYHWELSYSSPVPGAPATLPADATLNRLVLTEADIYRPLTITIAARMEDGRLGKSVVVNYSPVSGICETHQIFRNGKYWDVPAENCYIMPDTTKNGR